MRCHYAPIRMPKSKLLNIHTICWPAAHEDVEKLDLLYTAGGNVKRPSTSGKQSNSFFKFIMHLPYDPVILVLSI